MSGLLIILIFFKFKLLLIKKHETENLKQSIGSGLVLIGSPLDVQPVYKDVVYLIWPIIFDDFASHKKVIKGWENGIISQGIGPPTTTTTVSRRVQKTTKFG